MSVLRNGFGIDVIQEVKSMLGVAGNVDGRNIYRLRSFTIRVAFGADGDMDARKNEAQMSDDFFDIWNTGGYPEGYPAVIKNFPAPVRAEPPTRPEPRSAIMRDLRVGGEARESNSSADNSCDSRGGEILSECDICANRHRGASTSVAAHKRIRGALSARREAVYAHIKATGGITVDELAQSWNTTPNAISGRFTELARDGRIVKCGRRKTRSGCSAVVWRAKE